MSPNTPSPPPPYSGDVSELPPNIDKPPSALPRSSSPTLSLTSHATQGPVLLPDNPNLKLTAIWLTKDLNRGEKYVALVILDESTSGNWVSEDIVERAGLETHASEERKFLLYEKVPDREFTCIPSTRSVALPLWCWSDVARENRVWREGAELRVLKNPPFDMVFGKEMLESLGL